MALSNEDELVESFTEKVPELIREIQGYFDGR